MPADAVVLGPGEGRRLWTSVSHGAVRVESGPADFSVFESSPPPGLPEPAPHVHRSYDEAWFIIEGIVEFLLDGQHEWQGPRGFVFTIPRSLRTHYEIDIDAPPGIVWRLHTDGKACK